MDVNLLVGAATVAAAEGFSVWGPVFSKNGNGHSKELQEHYAAAMEQELATSQKLKTVPDWRLERDLALKELVDRLDYLPVRIEQAFRHSLEAQSQEPQIPPEWSARMREDLEHINDRLSEPPLFPPELERSLNRLTDRIEAFMQLPPPPPPEIPRVDDLIQQVGALIEMERKRAARDSHADRAKATSREAAIVARPSPTMAPPESRKARSVHHAAEPILLDQFNTLHVEEFTIHELRPPESGVFQVNLLNLGPGWLHVRANGFPDFDDEKSTTLPPGAIDNDIPVPRQLYVLATEDSTIVVRVRF